MQPHISVAGRQGRATSAQPTDVIAHLSVNLTITHPFDPDLVILLIAPDGTPQTLTKGEYALLVAFLEMPLRPLTRERLLQSTRVHEDIFDRSIDVQVLRLRRKLEIDPSAPRMICTERGVGYFFTLQVDSI